MEKRRQPIARAARLVLALVAFIAIVAMLAAASSGHGFEALPLVAFVLHLIEIVAPLTAPVPATASPLSRRLGSARAPPALA